MSELDDLSPVTAALAATADRYDRSGEFPADAIAVVHGAGLLTATVARRTEDGGWSISGRKRFVTGADGLSYFLVWAGTDEPTPRIATFVVPGDTPGIEIHRDWDQLGLRASGSHDVTFTDVRVPAENILDPIERGAKAEQDNKGLAALGVTVAAIYLGVAHAAQKAFHRFAHERVPADLGFPVARTDRFRDAAGEIEVNLAGARQLLYSVADAYDRGEDPEPKAAQAARILAVRQANAAVALATRLLGNPGLSRSVGLERHFRDIQFAAIHAPQDDIVLRQLGTAALEAAA